MIDKYYRAHAKVNLALDVVGKRDDGYHIISTVMQSLELHDTLYIKKVFKPNYLKLASNLSWLPNDERNLAWQAAEYLIRRFNIEEGIFINIEKIVPASAGLGGGSADCAAALLGIRDLFKLPLGNDELCELSIRFGADVPFCVRRGCAHATGIGEVLRPLPKLPQMYFLLARPPVIASTEEVFRTFNPEYIVDWPDVDKVVWGVENGNLKEMAAGMGNVLESVTVRRFPVINEVKAFMIEHGAVGAMMSGSGPTVFGIFEDRKVAALAGVAVKAAFPDIKEIFVTRPFYVEKK